MKTSNKLLVAIGIFCLLAPTIFAFVIKAKLNSGNFITSKQQWNNNNFIKELPPYKVAYLKGDLSDFHLSQDSAWQIRYQKSDSSQVRYHLSNDTLFVDIDPRVVNRVNSSPGGVEQKVIRSGVVLNLNFGPGVTSVISDSGNVSFVLFNTSIKKVPEFHLNNADFLYADHLENFEGSVPVGEPVLQLGNLKLISTGRGELDFSETTGADSLQVTINGSALLNLEDGHVKNLQLKASDSAQIKAPGYLLKNAYSNH